MAVAIELLPSPPSPPLKWAGGKRWLVPALLLIWTNGHEHRRLVEPFVGGLAIALGLAPKRAVLNDANPHLINFYRWIRRGLDPTAVDVPLVNDAKIFARNRDRFNELIALGQADSLEGAVLFYYLNRTAFNGLCRFNSSGYYNVPFGSYKKIFYKTAVEFESYKEVLREYDFTTGDFEHISFKPNDFVYSDPPYDVEFTSYSAGGFSWDDQVRLAERLARHKGPVVASNQATPRILRLYKGFGFRVRTLAAPRRISCDGNREDAREMLAFLNV